MELIVDAVVMPTGSGGTQGGFVAGLVAMNSAIRAIGMEIDAAPAVVEAAVREVAAGTLDLLGIGGGLPHGVVEINPDTTPLSTRVTHRLAGPASVWLPAIAAAARAA